MTSHDNVTDIVEPSNAEQSEWLDATRDYVHALETQNATLRANIATKADWIEKTINDMAVQDATIATLRKQLENARSEAIEEAARLSYTTVAGAHGSHKIAGYVADVIRALKGQP